MESLPNTASAQLSPELDPEALALQKKEKYERLFQRGVRFLAIGLLIMALSFAVNLLLYNFEGDFRLVMYLTTILGTCFILYGIGCIMGF